MLFTGSTDVARLIQRELACRLNPDGSPVPLIAETGGQNALVVDSSALAEQVVADTIASAFDSAGQRCSALRVLCLQDDAADRVLTMLRGATAELAVGDPRALSTDIGPVITAEAQRDIASHIQAMRDKGRAVFATKLPAACTNGTFIAPTIIELDSLSELTREVFGPVLHVLRYQRDELPRLMADIEATGYGLTFGIHTRLDETIARVTALSRAGNIYVNRNLIGAVVGVQPFGGHGLSGTGPKAGGPLYLHRLLSRCPAAPPITEMELTGPVGERNIYSTSPRGTVLCVGANPAAQISAATTTGNTVLQSDHPMDEAFDVVLYEGPADGLMALNKALAQRPGPIVPVLVPGAGGYRPEMLVLERLVSTNTAAAGGNASLMTLT